MICLKRVLMGWVGVVMCLGRCFDGFGLGVVMGLMWVF